ncbi:30S ribosomal protein S5 [Carex littledalei]|uniref:30S ribosomal protein S5 n=1 Tax=Carex littledalei TaxID=544730 RepID=A0A833QUJ2_9POAL|nr:30S ribosomal protein S5 [Carex littledalei]
MAASMATSLSQRLSLLNPKPLLLSHKPSLLSFSSPPPFPLLSLRCTPPDSSETPTPEDSDAAFSQPQSSFEGPMFDWPDDATVEEIENDYEQLYGAAHKDKKYSKDIRDYYDYIEDDVPERPVDDFEERVIEVVKQGKNMSYRAVVAVGDKKGHVGIGVCKAVQVTEAVVKAIINARRNIVTVPLTKYHTFPHRATGKFKAAEVMLRPAAPGSGIQSGAVVRTVLELAGVQHALGKQLRSDNALNNARATIVATQKMRHIADVAIQRGIPVQELWK